MMLVSKKNWKTCQTVPYTLDTFKHSIKNPIICEDKSDITLVGFYTLIERSKRQLSKGRVIRMADNFKYQIAIVLDYDNGYTPKQFIKDYASLKLYCFMYTTYSHSKEKDKFRVVIPLKDPVPVEFMRKNYVRNALEDIFPEADPSTFYAGRFFYIPAKKKGGLYGHKILNDGCEALDFYSDFGSVIKNKKEVMEKKGTISSSDGQIGQEVFDDVYTEKKWYILPPGDRIPLSIILKSIKGQLDQLDFQGRGCGVIHTTLLKKNAQMNALGMSKGQILDIMLPYAIDEDSEKEITDIVMKCNL